MGQRVCPSCLVSTNEDTCPDCRVPTIDEASFALPDPLIGQTYAKRFQVISRIGDGGMGVVYKAHELQVERDVALKILRRELARDLPTVQRFYREMRATSRISHPNTVRVYDFGHGEDGSLYLSMELLRGATLAEEMGRCGPMPPARVVRIAIQIAKALRAAHAEGIIHRDLKPENVMLADHYGEADSVKVLDFGIARFADPGTATEQRSLTRTGLVVGTPAYVSPEAATGEKADERADLYSLGVLIYHLLVGELPFDDSNPISVLYKHVHDAPAPPSERGVVGVPAALEGLVMSLLSKRPADRPPSADVLITLLSVSLSSAANVVPPSTERPVRRDTVPSMRAVADRRAPSDRRGGAERRLTGESGAVAALARLDPRGERRRALLWAGIGAALASAVAALLFVTGIIGAKAAPGPTAVVPAAVQERPPIAGGAPPAGDGHEAQVP